MNQVFKTQYAFHPYRESQFKSTVLDTAALKLDTKPVLTVESFKTALHSFFQSITNVILKSTNQMKYLNKLDKVTIF